MPNAHHLEILHEGVESWNRWRSKNGSARPNLNSARLSHLSLTGVDFSEADLSNADLASAEMTGADLSGANLYKARFDGARLARARFSGAYLAGASLPSADLAGADLRHVDLTGANLTGATLASADLSGSNSVAARYVDANLSEAQLVKAQLYAASLRGACLARADLSLAELSRSDLRGANLHQAVLDNANLNQARVGLTVFADVDLCSIKDLGRLVFGGPCSLGVDTLRRCRGLLLESFLKGCGLEAWEIAVANLFDPELSADAAESIHRAIVSLRKMKEMAGRGFISYSRSDLRFVEVLERALKVEGLIFWRDQHELKAGRIETQIAEGMRRSKTVLLILSERSVRSDWVQWEAWKARELEKDLGHDVLCPIALDESWKTCRWPGPLRKQIEEYNVLDFSEWEDAVMFAAQLERLVAGLRQFYPFSS